VNGVRHLFLVIVVGPVLCGSVIFGSAAVARAGNTSPRDLVAGPLRTTDTERWGPLTYLIYLSVLVKSIGLHEQGVNAPIVLPVASRSPS